MPLSWNEIKARALRFSHEWANETSEISEAKSFLDGFFNVFGISRRRVATFETRVKKIDGKDGYIDLLWKGILIIEQKSYGKDLTRAYNQAIDYFPGIKERELPRYVLVSDFARFRLYDLEENTEHEFKIKYLYKNVRRFGFIAGYQTTSYKEQDPVNIYAAERMGKLHDKLKAIGYSGHELEVYLVRLLFCLFAQDSSIFERRQLQELIEQRTSEDGQDLAQWLEHLFEILNTPEDKRLKTLDEQLAAFPYVNGSLFAERLHMAAFDKEMREMVLECCSLDWSRISPAIFGALFQSVMDPELRRSLGAHYTSEKNILKLIKPLFLDELRDSFEHIKNHKKALREFHKYISQLKFLDPACGCGNFLVISYRALRELELDILRELNKGNKQGFIDVKTEIKCDVDQFFGVEIEEFPAQIAQTALWLMDHQMNMRVSEEFGLYFRRLPLMKSPMILNANALRHKWTDIIKPQKLNYILGNPPFGGKQHQSKEQKEDIQKIFHDIPSAGILDYVTPWYRKAVEFMEINPNIKTAYVSTNSITQGEQVGALWKDFIRRGVKINFAHRTFQWSSEARGAAAVHCVIIGFAMKESGSKLIFDYDTPHSEPHIIKAKNINPYLVDAPDVILLNRTRQVSGAPMISFGNMPNDGGFLLLTDDDKNILLEKEPEASVFIRSFISAREFLNGKSRWCLWLLNIHPQDLNKMPEIKKRVLNVKNTRQASPRSTTRQLAQTPTLFGEIRQPRTDYILIPRHSSENRLYIPFGFLKPTDIVADSCLAVEGASLYHFGILSSSMHMAWVRNVCGRIKNDYRYSSEIVYNNFPWPHKGTSSQEKTIKEAAEHILEIRSKYFDSSLADLYHPLSMPADLVRAHHKLDAAVDKAYGKRHFSGDASRVSFLFELYGQLASPLEISCNR